jgi:replication factor A1
MVEDGEKKKDWDSFRLLPRAPKLFYLKQKAVNYMFHLNSNFFRLVDSWMKPNMLYVVKALREGLKSVEIRVRVLEKNETRVVKTKNGQEHNVADLLVGDVSGVTGMSLWDEMIDKIGTGEVIDVRNGYVNKFKGQLRLNIGKYGDLEKVEDDSFPSISQILKGRRIYKKRGKAKQ